MFERYCPYVVVVVVVVIVVTVYGGRRSCRCDRRYSLWWLSCLSLVVVAVVFVVVRVACDSFHKIVDT